MADERLTGAELRETVRKRGDLLASVTREPATKPTLVDRLGVSRSTVDRAVDALLEAGLVRRTESRYHATEQGRLARATYEEYVTRTDALAEAEPILSELPADVRVHRRLVETGTVRIAEPQVPETAIMEAVNELGSAEELFVFSPVVKSNYIRPVYREVAERDLAATLVLERDATESLASLAAVTGDVDSLLTAESFTLSQTDRELPFLLYLMTGPEGDAVGITVHDDGAIVGSVTTDDPEAVAWGRDRFEEVRADADPVSPSSLM